MYWYCLENNVSYHRTLSEVGGEFRGEYTFHVSLSQLVCAVTSPDIHITHISYRGSGCGGCRRDTRGTTATDGQWSIWRDWGQAQVRYTVVFCQTVQLSNGRYTRFVRIYTYNAEISFFLFSYCFARVRQAWMQKRYNFLSNKFKSVLIKSIYWN